MRTNTLSAITIDTEIQHGKPVKISDFFVNS